MPLDPSADTQSERTVPLVKSRVHRILILGNQLEIANGLKQELLAISPSLTAAPLALDSEHHELELTLMLEAPTAVFLETSSLDKSLQIARWIRETDRNLQIIGFSPAIGTEELLQCMRAGVREWIPLPASPDALAMVLERVQIEAANNPPAGWNHGELISFLPAKPGSGASTIALHAAQSCAPAAGSRVLVMDLDLHCGTLGFASQARGGLTINEALQHAHQLDAALWAKLLARSGELDILPAGPPAADTERVETGQLRRVLAFAGSRYKVIVADLPGQLDRAAVLALEQSAHVFVVCTTDLASLHLARRTLDLCRSMGLGEKIHVVVNRANFNFGLTRQGVVEILRQAPLAWLPNAFIPLQMALKDGRLLDERTPFVQALDPIVELVTGPRPLRDAPAERWRFLPGLSVPQTLRSLLTAIGSFGSAPKPAVEPAAPVLAPATPPVPEPAGPTAVGACAEPAPVRAASAASRRKSAPREGRASPAKRRSKAEKPSAPPARLPPEA